MFSNSLFFFQDNLTEPKSDIADRPQAFDLFSPIPVEQKQAIVNLNQPRVLSMDSGNFSVNSKHENQLMTTSGDALKPIVIHATSDSISAISMNDMTNWYNGKCLLYYRAQT